MVGQLPRCRVRQMRPDGTQSTGQEGQGRTGTGSGRGTRSEPPARSTGVANRHVHRTAIALPVIVRDRDCGTGATSDPSRRAPWPQRCQIGRGPGARPKARLVSAHGTDRSAPGTRFAPLLRPPRDRHDRRLVSLPNVRWPLRLLNRRLLVQAYTDANSADGYVPNQDLSPLCVRFPGQFPCPT